MFVLISSTTANLSADETQGENLTARLAAIYQSYKVNPLDSCRQLEETLQSNDSSSLEAKDVKAAYYFLANCQYQSGQLDAALKSYLKVSELDPNDHQPLLDAGSVYVQQGLYARAESIYRKALIKVSANPLEEERIQALIKNMPGKLQNIFTVSTGVGYDSNVNSGPKDNIHLLYGEFNYTLDSDAKPRDDFYLNNSVGTALSKALNPETVVLFNVSAENTNYFSEKHFNTSVFAATAGYKKLFGNKSVTFSPFVNYQTLDVVSYQISSGLNVSGAVKVSDKVNVWPSVSVHSQSFFNDKLRDGVGTSIGTGASYAFNPKTSWIGNLFYSYNNADNDQYTYNNVFIGNSVNHALTDHLSAALGYNLQIFYYADADPTFGTSRRDDGHTFYLNFDYALNRFVKKNKTFLSLNISYNQNNSNHSFQDTNRLFTALKLTFSF